MKKCPSSIWCWDLNSRPLEHEPPLITTGPGLPPSRVDFLFHLKYLNRIPIGIKRYVVSKEIFVYSFYLKVSWKIKLFLAITGKEFLTKNVQLNVRIRFWACF